MNTLLTPSRPLIQDALVALYRQQTLDEQQTAATLELNGVGFNGVDATFGSSLAEQVLAGRSLSPKQLAMGWKILQKYHKQLASYLDLPSYEGQPRYDEPEVQATPKGKDPIKAEAEAKSKLGFVGKIAANKAGTKLYIRPFVYPTPTEITRLYTWDREHKLWVAETSAEALAVVDQVKLEIVGTLPVLNEPEVPTWEVEPGWVEIIDGELWFFPKVYPTTQLKGTGWGWVNSPRKGFKKAWRSSLGLDLLYALMEHFPVKLHPTVQAWLDKTNNPTYLEDLEKLTGNGGAYKPFSYQVEAASFALHFQRVIIGLEPGLGKTIVAAIAAKYQTFQKVLVVAPLSLLRNWEKEIARWYPSAHVTVAHKKLPKTRTGSPSIVLTNYETAIKYQNELQAMDWDLVICDETILVKNRKTKRYSGLDTIVNGGEPVPYVWFLTGSPASRYLDDMWSQLNLLNPKRFSSYWRFAERYCFIERTQWGASVKANKPGSAEAIKRDMADIYFSRSQSQVTDIPDHIFEEVYVSMGKKQSDFYRLIEEEMLLGLEGLAPDETLRISNVLAAITRSIQAASNPSLIEMADGAKVGPDVYAKWDALIDQLEFQPGPHLVWTVFIPTAERLAGMLAAKGYRVAVLTGNTKTDDRQAVVDSFQAGELDILIAHPAVGKFGFTLTRARTSHYLERSYNGDNYFQSLFRNKRIGTEVSPLVLHYIAEYENGDPTIDQVVHGILNYRTMTSKTLTAGDFSILRKG